MTDGGFPAFFLACFVYVFVSVITGNFPFLEKLGLESWKFYWTLVKLKDLISFEAEADSWIKSSVIQGQPFIEVFKHLSLQEIKESWLCVLRLPRDCKSAIVLARSLYATKGKTMPLKIIWGRRNEKKKNNNTKETNKTRKRPECKRFRLDLVHSTGQDLLPRGKGHNRTSRSLTRCPASPIHHLHTKDSHSTGIKKKVVSTKKWSK